MNDKYKEWLKQAEYDMDTAKVMFDGGRYFYAVFMCHLSIEKALKSLYLKVKNEAPPKTHNLIYLLNKISKRPEQELEKFVTKLNTASIATRYPDELEKIQEAYTAAVTTEMIKRSEETLQWIKTQL